MGQRQYFGQFTHEGAGYSLEGDDADCLYVERLTSATSAELVCVITGRDRKYSHEILTPDGAPLPDGYRNGIIFAAMDQYLHWKMDHTDGPFFG